MITLLRLLLLVGAIEAAMVVTIYLALTDWRTRGRVGWFLLSLGGSLAWMLTLVVVGWWFEVPRLAWLPGLVVFDAALGLQILLMLRRK